MRIPQNSLCDTHRCVLRDTRRICRQRIVGRISLSVICMCLKEWLGLVTAPFKTGDTVPYMSNGLHCALCSGFFPESDFYFLRSQFSSGMPESVMRKRAKRTECEK